MSKYFVMACDGVPPIAQVSCITELEDDLWMRGVQVDDPGVTIEYRIHRSRPGNLRALYEELSVPIMHEDLLAALRTAGVDNLQLFKASIHDPADGSVHPNYFAFNVLGRISAADMGKSKLMHPHSLTGVDHAFDQLVLSDARIPAETLMFRLAEAANAIVVHEKVKSLVEKSKIAGMVFYASGEWSG